MFATPHFRSSRSAILALCALAATAVPSARAASATYDAQIPFSFSSLSLLNPEGVAVYSNGGEVYIADPSVGVIQISPTGGTLGGGAEGAASLRSTAVTLNTGLTAPTTVAVDSNGNLYAADATDGKVIELPNPVTSSTPVTITYSTGETPTALAVDSNNNLYIADGTKGAIYKVLSGSHTGTIVPITLPSKGKPTLEPVGLAADSAGDIYFANESNNTVYEYTAATGVTAVFLGAPGTASTWDFSASSAFPIGMGLDPAGNLYVMDSGSGNLIEITPGAANNFQLPLTSGVTPTGMAVSSIGNLYISDNAGKTADEVFYNNNPFNFGSIPAGTNSPAVTVNFLFASHAAGAAIYQSLQGDIVTNFASSSTTCAGTTGTLCSMAFYVNYSSSTPGTKNGVVGLTDNNADLFTVPNTGISEASALSLYPGTQFTLSQSAQPLYEPQALAVTGNGGTLFVADEGESLSGGVASFTNGAVWEYTITGGAPGGTAVDVGNFPTPDALALDSAGNLYVADYSGTVTMMPVSYDKSKKANMWPDKVGVGTVLPLTGMLNHPMALAFDPSGNLYIGDMGSGGVDASASNPGYIIKVPAGGGPAVRLNYTIGGVPIVFPDALATDSFGNLYIADGGDGDTDPGGVDVVPVGGSPVAISFSSVTPPALNQPSGLAFDAANDLYVLDGFNQRVLVVPMNYPGGVPTADTADISLLGQGSSGLSTLVTPSNLVVWPGGQSITVSDIGFEPQSAGGNPTQVLTLQSVNETVNASSGPVSVTGVNVGNEPIEFQPDTNTNSASFSFTGCGSGTGGNGGATLAIGAAPTCSPTVAFIGTGTKTATITLNGTLATDFSALGNKILATGEPNEPIANLTAPTFSFSATNTATLSNTGNVALSISNIQVTGDATQASGGTCSTITPLAPNSSCTINFTINGAFETGTVTVTDNSGNNPASVQTASTFYLFSFSLVITKAGGASLGLTPADIPRNLLVKDTSSSSNTLIQPTITNSSTKGAKKSK
jgi:sugar lactone lactonase YvrE